MNQHFLPADIDAVVGDLGEAAREFSGKTVLIAGGLGFLGRFFIQLYLRLNATVLEKPCRLVVLDNLITTGNWAERSRKPEGYEFIDHDVVKPFSFDDPINYIMHLAGIASPFYYREYPLETLDVAVQGTKNMLELARANGAKLLFFSSSEIYGDPDAAHVPTPESYRGNVSCLGPRACYDESKRLGETLCRIYQQRYGVHTNIVRPFNVYGPGMQERDYRVLPNFASQIAGSRPLTVYGTGHQTRTYCYLSDAIIGFILALLRGVPGEPYNIGNPKPEISVLELVEIIRSVLGRDIELVLMEHPDTYPADEPNRRCPDIRKARTQLQYSPKVELRDGLNRFLSWTATQYTGDV